MNSSPPYRPTRSISRASSLEDRRQLLQHRVAGLVPVRVVHALEVVQVAHHAGERLGEPLRVLEHLLEPLLRWRRLSSPVSPSVCDM